MNFMQNGKASLEQTPTAEENPFIFYLILFIPSESYMPLLISVGALPGPASSIQEPKAFRYLQLKDMNLRDRLKKCELCFQHNFN